LLYFYKVIPRANNQGGKGWDFKLSELLSGTLAREQDRSQQIGPVLG